MNIQWIEVHPDTLPKVGQEIFVVEDLRGSLEQVRRRIINRVLEKDPTIGYINIGGGQHFNLFPKLTEEMVFVHHGWVEERYLDCFVVRMGKDRYDPVVYPEHITHWMPIPTFQAVPLTLDDADERYQARIKAMKAVADQLDWTMEQLQQYQEQNRL